MPIRLPNRCCLLIVRMVGTDDYYDVCTTSVLYSIDMKMYDYTVLFLFVVPC